MSQFTSSLTEQTRQFIDLEEIINGWLELNPEFENNGKIVDLLGNLKAYSRENNDIIENINREITYFDEYQDESSGRRNKTVGCFQQICNCSASDSDFPMSIDHNKYCRFAK